MLVNMKKTFLKTGTALLLSLLLLVLAGCEKNISSDKAKPSNHTENDTMETPPETEKEPSAWNAFSTAGDISEITWYLQQVHGISDFSTCRYYDFDDMHEAAMVFVQLPETDDIPGSFLLFGHSRDLPEYGLYRYEESPLKEVSRQEMGVDAEDNTVWQIIFQAANGGEIEPIYMTFDEEGRILRMLCGMITSQYFYNPDGTIAFIDCQELAWDTDESYYDFVTGNTSESSSHVRLKYEYYPDGSLRAVYGSREPDDEDDTPLFEENGFLYFLFQSYGYDENGFRIEITDSEWEEDTLTYTRDDLGRIVDHTLIMEDGESVEGDTYVYTYLPDGSVKVSEQ